MEISVHKVQEQLNYLTKTSGELRMRSERSQFEKFDLMQGIERNNETEQFEGDLETCQAVYEECLRTTKPEDQFKCSQKLTSMMKRL